MRVVVVRKHGVAGSRDAEEGGWGRTGWPTHLRIPLHVQTWLSAQGSRPDPEMCPWRTPRKVPTLTGIRFSWQALREVCVLEPCPPIPHIRPACRQNQPRAVFLQHDFLSFYYNWLFYMTVAYVKGATRLYLFSRVSLVSIPYSSMFSVNRENQCPWMQKFPLVLKFWN